MPISGECEHGQLARQCPLCEYEAEIKSLEKKVVKMEEALEEIAYSYEGMSFIDLVMTARSAIIAKEKEESHE